MNFTIWTKPAFAVLGMEGRGPAGAGPAWITPLWAAANGRFGEITDLILRDEAGNPTGLWGAMSDTNRAFHPWGAEGLYLAGCECPVDVTPPPGWALWQVPGFTYLCVACGEADYRAAMEYGLQEAMPQAGYRLCGAIQEHYRPGQPGLELCFPVKRI